MAKPISQHGPDSRINASSKSPKIKPQSGALSLRGQVTPISEREKQKSSYNAVKHGIFAVGLVRDRESRAEYHRIVADMVDTLQPVRRLEEILVEKLAMLEWRYGRLLQAEAAEVEREGESAEEGNLEGKTSAMHMLRGETGLIPGALLTKNEVALQASIEELKELRQLVQEKGLKWDRDRGALKVLYGSVKEQGEKGHITLRVIGMGKGNQEEEGPDPIGPLASKYRELAGAEKDQQGAADVPRDAAKSMVGMLTEKIEAFEMMLRDWCERSDDRNRLQATAALIPKQEVTDRLQRYEGSLERSFDRTLSQLERLQRLRLGQPVLPALKVDVSH